jgi:hypothetical protein
MTTATINFDQPTLFRDGRFSSDDDPPPRTRRQAPTPTARPAAPPREPDALVPASPPAAPPGADAPRGHRTLDDVLAAAWDGLTAHQSVTCPVCSGSMAPRYGSGAQPVGGRCRRCGSTLG